MWMISMKAVLDIVSQYCPDDDGSCSKAGVDLREMLDEIEGLDETEVEPVKHGRWIEKIVGRMKWIPYADDNVNPDSVDIERMTEQKCSYCKRWTIKFTDHIELDYCPLCGAKMDVIYQDDKIKAVKVVGWEEEK